MTNVFLCTSVKPDGSLTLPPFAVRGLGYQPGAVVRLTLPTDICAQECEGGGLLVKRVCGDDGSEGYTTYGGEINIPLALLSGASIPPGNEIIVLSSDGMLIIAAVGEGYQSDLADVLGCLMADLGYDPETVEAVEAALPILRGATP